MQGAIICRFAKTTTAWMVEIGASPERGARTSEDVISDEHHI